jgi:hypothetical protein
MKKLSILFATLVLLGCSNTHEERYGIKNYDGEIRYDGETAELHLQFYSLDFEDYCEISLTDSHGQHTYHSKSSGYGFPYELKNKDLAEIIPLSYKLQWNSTQMGYDKLVGGSPDSEMYAILALRDFDYIDGAGTYSGRCHATTLKGTRCKRGADKGGIYCWQHK